MTPFVWKLRYIRWWRKRLEDWDRKQDVRWTAAFADSWLDPDNWDAINEGIEPEDAAWEDASNA